jgi:hypothetical protein
MPSEFAAFAAELFDIPDLTQLIRVVVRLGTAALLGGWRSRT